MAVRTEGDRVFGNICPAIGKPTDVVDFQEGATVRLGKGRTLAAKLALSVGALENPALDLWVATYNSDFSIAARGSANAFWRSVKRLEGFRQILEFVPIENLAFGTPKQPGNALANALAVLCFCIPNVAAEPACLISGTRDV